MRNRVESEVLVTTVVVKGPVSPLQAEWQHRLVTEAVTAGMSVGTGLQQPLYRVGTRQRRAAKEPPRIFSLLLSVLLLAGAVFFFYLAMK